MSGSWMNAVPPVIVVVLALQNGAHQRLKKDNYFVFFEKDWKNEATIMDGVVMLCLLFRTVLLFIEYL